MIRTRSFVIGSLFGLTIVLSLLGVIMVLSASQFVFLKGTMENIYQQNVYQFMGRQLIWISLGLACMGFFYSCDFNVWDRHSRLILLATMVLLVLVLSPLGVTRNGAQRWLPVGSSHFLFQPSEFAKLAVILYLSSVWAGRPDRLTSVKGVIFPMLLVGTLLGLILPEPDNSTTFFIGMIALTIWFVAGGRIIHLTPGFLFICTAVAVALYKKPHLWERINAWIDPDKYPNKAYHFLRARDGFAHGGMWGVGLGEGKGQLGFTPEAHTDFIFSIMGEELGFVKCALVILLFLSLALLGYWIAMRCSNPFGRLVAAGCTTALIMQAALNFAVVTGSIPTTGIALPFISYGGSSLLACMAMIGLLMNIAKETFDTENVPARPRKRPRAWAAA